MKQLSMTDAFMLAVQSGTQRLEMATVLFIEAPGEGQVPLTRERLRELVAERIHLAPSLTRKIAHVPLGLDFPYWVDDDELDLDRHIAELELPPGSGDRELALVVSRVVSRPLDERRPLWKAYVINGLADGRQALMLKLHHAAVDGISGLQAHAVLFDPPPGSAAGPPASPAPAQARPALLGRAVAGLPNQVRRAVFGGLRSLPYLDQLMPFRVTPGAGTIAAAARRLTRLAGSPQTGLEGAARMTVPETIFDVPAVGRRRWAFSRVSLSEIKAIKNYFGVTVNDVIVTAMSGAVRSWLLEMGELPSQPLVALVPVSVRADDTEAGGNQVQVMLVEVPTNEPDPAVRLSKTHEALVAAKERHGAVPAAARQAADGLLMPIIFKPASLAAMKLSGRAGASSNMVVSNMPGPAQPVLVDGRRVEGIFPVGGVVEGFGFSTIVFSYCDELEFGFVLDEGSDADPWRLGEAMQREQAVLHALVKQDSPAS